MMALSNQERVAALEEVIEKMDECASLLRSLRDREIDAYCLADFEGRKGGWLGDSVRYILERKLRTALSEDGDDEDAG